MDLFKAALLIILVGFLFIAYQYSQNGRYYFISRSGGVMDTHNGTIKDYNYYHNR